MFLPLPNDYWPMDLVWKKPDGTIERITEQEEHDLIDTWDLPADWKTNPTYRVTDGNWNVSVREEDGKETDLYIPGFTL